MTDFQNPAAPKIDELITRTKVGRGTQEFIRTPTGKAVVERAIADYRKALGELQKMAFQEWTGSSEEELKILTELGEAEGTLEEEESEMIQSIMEFNNKEAGEILTPRVDIIGIDASSTLDTIMDLISTKQFSKIPVYVDNIDNIKGIIHAKDVTPYLIGSRPNINLLSIRSSIS